MIECNVILSFDFHYVSLASRHGADSEQVGGLLVALAGMVVEDRGVGEGGGGGKDGEERDRLRLNKCVFWPGLAEELLRRAHSIYCTVHGKNHEKSIICKV